VLIRVVDVLDRCQLACTLRMCNCLQHIHILCWTCCSVLSWKCTFLIV